MVFGVWCLVFVGWSLNFGVWCLVLELSVWCIGVRVWGRGVAELGG